MNKEELIEHVEGLYAKQIEILKSFKDGDFFKITYNNKIVRWGSFKNFRVTENGVIKISTHLNYNPRHKGFETSENDFMLTESRAIEKMKSTELLVFMLKLREQNLTFDRRNKIITNNLTIYENN
jgi:hypothetical protein